MPESIQKRLTRVRPPRVQITYDLQVGEQSLKKELPLVVGVMSDLSGKRLKPLPPIKERKFTEIDGGNFDEVLEAISPHLEFKVDNHLTDEGGRFDVELDFKSMDDFHPSSLIQRVEPLRKLFEARQRLLDLFVKLDGNEELESLLQAIVRNSGDLRQISDMTHSVEETDSAAPATTTDVADDTSSDTTPPTDQL